MPSSSYALLRSLSVMWVALFVAEVSGTEAADPFRERVLPFVKTYCVACHNQKTTEGELDLTRYTSPEAVAADYRKWEHVVIFLTKEEMPPPDAKQPAARERAEVLQVLGKLLLEEARKTAGDPGVVLPRRLSNAEYNYAIRDLTGIDIRPADSFPIDPASGEGFNNTGEALVMSPNLFKKYYAAAQYVADHVLLTPTRMEFAPHSVVTFADQTKLTEQAVLRFYERHKVDYSKYLTVAWRYRHRPAGRQAVSVEEWASEARISPSYFRRLWNVLENVGEANDTFFLKWLRQSWKALPQDKLDDSAIHTLANDIQRLSLQLCLPETDAIVGNAGNGPVQHIDRRSKTAANRDAFNPAVVSDHRRVHVEIVPFEEHEFLLTLRVEPWSDLFAVATNGDGAAATKDSAQAIPSKTSDTSVVFKNLVFSPSSPQSFKPNDPQRNVSLKALLTEFAPSEATRLLWGLDQQGNMVDPDSLVLEMPSSVTIAIPAKAFRDKSLKHFFADVSLDPKRTNDVAVLAWATTVNGDPKALDRSSRQSRPKGGSHARQSVAELGPSATNASHGLTTVATTSLPLITPQHDIAKEFAASGAAFCRLFPNRFYFADETRGLSAGFHLIEGFFRDDQPLCKLVLSESENRELDRLWDELSFVTGVTEKMLRGFVFFERSERNFMKHPDFDSIKEEDPELTSDETLNRFEQIYLTRSGVKGTAEEIETHPIHTFFEGFRWGLKRRAAQWPAAVPIYQKRLLEFAQAAYRRPLTKAEEKKLMQFFNEAVAFGLPLNDVKPAPLSIEHAVRATVVRILVSPHFCYLADAAPAGDGAKPLPDLALASRLSFFLWSSVPDAELLKLAEAGELNNEATLRAQTRRMLQDPKVSGFALEFFGQWLNYRDFRQSEAVNRSVFPAFDDPLKQAMFEEPTRLVTLILQNDRPITDLLRSDATFVNKRLAQHYGVPFPEPPALASGIARPTDDWQLVTGLHQRGRSGLLGMAVFLTKNSQPQRTSPVKRGFWVVHKLLGEHIPPPPPDVAVLPAKETDTDGKTIRQLLAAHTEDVKCARCHQRFDPIGLAMEGFDSIGRSRNKDLAGRAIDNAVQLPSGEQAHGVSEFSEYLAKHRRSDFTRTLNRKLLGYALGRSLQLSDLVLLEQMEATLQENDDRVVPLFETVVTSAVFRNQRGRDVVRP
ncbi:MAG: DUF1592 domain-containing protein [Planctomycetaceae bacterium]